MTMIAKYLCAFLLLLFGPFGGEEWLGQMVTKLNQN